MKRLTLVLFLLVATSAGAQERTIFRIGLGAYGVTAVKDAVDTRKCVDAGTCREVNPVIVPFANRHGIKKAMAGKLAAQTGLGTGLYWLHGRYPLQSTLAIWGLAALQFAVDVHNVHQIQRSSR